MSARGLCVVRVAAGLLLLLGSAAQAQAPAAADPRGSAAAPAPLPVAAPGAAAPAPPAPPAPAPAPEAASAPAAPAAPQPPRSPLMNTAAVEQRAAAGEPRYSIVAPGGARRHAALTFSPLTLMQARYGLTLDIVPASHHGITLSAFYAYTHTNSDSNNTFAGVGGELGYRYYLGHDGPRGLFFGPSLLLGRYDATPPPGLGDKITFTNWGAALDIGWAATVIDRVALGVAAGVQYTNPTVNLPTQELPAAIYANRSVMPRLNIHLGIAF